MARKKSIDDIYRQLNSIRDRIAEEFNATTDPQRRAELMGRDFRAVNKALEYRDNIMDSKGYKRNRKRLEAKFDKEVNAQPLSQRAQYEADNWKRHSDGVFSYKAGQRTYMGLSNG